MRITCAMALWGCAREMHTSRFLDAPHPSPPPRGIGALTSLGVLAPSLAGRGLGVRELTENTADS